MDRAVYIAKFTVCQLNSKPNTESKLGYVGVNYEQYRPYLTANSFNFLIRISCTLAAQLVSMHAKAGYNRSP